MLNHLAKNAIITMALSLIFIHMQAFAAQAGSIIQSLQPYPQPNIVAPPLSKPKKNLIIEHTINPTIPTLDLTTPKNTANIDSNKNFMPIPMPTQENIFKQNMPAQQNMPALPIQETFGQQELSGQDKAIEQNEASRQEALRSAATKILSGQAASPLSLIDYFLKTDQDAQNKSMNKDNLFIPMETGLPMGTIDPLTGTILPMGTIPPATGTTLPTKTPAPQKKIGDALMLSNTAKITKNLDFLEGCWVGYRPEYLTKRMITERFCFDAKGIGKRYVLDAKYSITCVGDTKAEINKDGFLDINSGIMQCSPSGEQWGGAKMQCQNEREKTFCTLFFTNIHGATQSYKATFIRE